MVALSSLSFHIVLQLYISSSHYGYNSDTYNQQRTSKPRHTHTLSLSILVPYIMVKSWTFNSSFPAAEAASDATSECWECAGRCTSRCGSILRICYRVQTSRI